MTDDSDDPQSADGDDDAATDSQIDDVLDRLESSVSETAEPPLDDPELDTATDSPIDSPSSSTDSPEPPIDSPPSSTGSPEPPTDQTTPTEKQSADDRSDGGRLWDRFGSEQGADEQSSSHSTPSESEPATTELSTDDDSHTPDGDDESIADRVETATDRTSFRGILDRISHRIGSATTATSSDGEPTQSDQPHTEETDSDTETTETTNDESLTASRAEPSTSADERQSTASGAATGQRGGRDPQTQSARIDQVLENIDLFGRATASSQVLLLSPTAHSVTNDIYQRVLLPTDGTGQNILFVSAIQSSHDQAPAVKKIPDWSQGQTGVIEVGQSVLQSSQPGSGDPAATLDVYKRMSNFQNLAKLGVNISHVTSQWNATGRPTVVGVHTLSSIQQYVGNESMFQFLFTLKGQLNSLGVRGFYHMDPAAHTENELETINSAFDIVLTVSSDGSIDIK